MAAGALALAGCQRENPTDEFGLGDGQIRYSVSNVGVKSSAGDVSGAASLSLVSSDGKLTVPATCEVSDGINLPENTSATKGALINTTLHDETLPAGLGFTVSAYKGSAVQFEKKTATKSGDYWTMDPPQYWPISTKLTFYAYTNAGNNTVSQTATSQTLTYTVTDDATAHKDLMLGYYKGNGSSRGIAEIRFDHPLTAVRFKQGLMEDVQGIKSITISGLASGGTVEMDEEGVIGDWTVSDTEYKTEVSLLPSGAATTLDVDADSFIGTDATGNYNGAFLLVPQNLASHKATVTAVLATESGDEVTVSADITSGKWEAGKTNTYTLGYLGDLDFTFELTNPADANLAFNNTSSDSAVKEISLNSFSSKGGGTPTDAEWGIKSVKADLGDAEPVTGDTPIEIGGLKIQKVNGKLTVQALAREMDTPGHNAYWRNTSSRTDNLGWSPEDWSVKGTIDLSKFDPYTDTENAHAMTTANCYVIRHAGTYKLPLVYGNAIVNGAFNEQSYYPNVTGGTNRLERFLNHLGNGIISPFIEYNTKDGKAKDDSNFYLSPASGTKGYEIVWQDRADIITIGGISKEPVTVKDAGGVSQTFDVSYIKFTIPQDKICQNNAIIAVKDGSGNIMWSWHIWTTNDPALLSGSVPVTNYTNVEYDFFPLSNLGWIDQGCYPAREDVKIVLAQKDSFKEIEITVRQNFVSSGSSNGCYYQFGRKDPMCTTDSPAQGTFTRNVAGGSTLALSILNPDKFYNFRGNTTDDQFDWLTGTHYYNLWTGKKSEVGFYDQDAYMIKTIYDPSPVGYKMPASTAFTGFTTTGANVQDPSKNSYNVYGDFSNGWYFYTKPGKKGDVVFFPAAGCRIPDNGSLKDVSIGGNYWSAVPKSLGTACYMSTYATLVYPVYALSRAYGFLVRPVIE